MTDHSPILLAHILNGPDRGICDEATLIHTLRDETLGWVHLSGTHTEAEDWIMRHLDYLDPQAAEALLDVDTRPRMSAMGDGMIVILRGMNWNEGEDPEDMVSVRMYIDAHRIVTIARKRVRSIEKLDADIRVGRGPETAGDFLFQLIEYLVGGIGNFQRTLDQQAETLEDAVILEGTETLRRSVVDMRLQVIAALRFLIPQRDVLARYHPLGQPLYRRQRPPRDRRRGHQDDPHRRGYGRAARSNHGPARRAVGPALGPFEQEHVRYVRGLCRLSAAGVHHRPFRGERGGDAGHPELKRLSLPLPCLCRHRHSANRRPDVAALDRSPPLT